jgi:peroxiredoxin
MYPHERSLVKRLEGKPFALLGINSDSKERLRKAMTKEKITWRSWWDGGNTEGPIAKAWNVKGWPTIYVLDHKGVIRYRDVREKELDAAVDALLKELAEGK